MSGLQAACYEKAALTPLACAFPQLYVNRDRSKTEDILRKVVKAGYKGLVVTVDAPVAGKRERDERASLDPQTAADPGFQKAAAADAPDAPDAPDANTDPAKGGKQGIAQLFGYVDPALNMTTDIKWLKSFGLPLVIKGVQTAEDAALLAAAGVDAIYLSNHGGRQLEGAPTALETLVELRARERWVFSKCEVWVDGGVRRGTDVLKALALGAKGVGIGRPCEWRRSHEPCAAASHPLTNYPRRTPPAIPSRSHVLTRVRPGRARPGGRDPRSRARAEPSASRRDEAVRADACDGQHACARGRLVRAVRQPDLELEGGWDAGEALIWAGRRSKMGRGLGASCIVPRFVEGPVA